MNEWRGKVSVLEFRRLLVELKEHRPDICMRYRLIGQMWAQSFHHVVYVTEDSVTLNDESSNKLITIRDFSQIMQFELDKPFQSYAPYFHYDVLPAPDW